MKSIAHRVYLDVIEIDIGRMILVLSKSLSMKRFVFHIIKKKTKVFWRQILNIKATSHATKEHFEMNFSGISISLLYAFRNCVLLFQPYSSRQIILLFMSSSPYLMSYLFCENVCVCLYFLFCWYLCISKAL